MTVSLLDTVDGIRRARCVWFEGATVKYGEFDIRTIELSAPDGKSKPIQFA